MSTTEHDPIAVPRPLYLAPSGAPALDIPARGGGKVGTVYVNYAGEFPGSHGEYHRFGFTIEDADGFPLDTRDGLSGGVGGPAGEDGEPSYLDAIGALLTYVIMDLAEGGTGAFPLLVTAWAAEHYQEITVAAAILAMSGERV